MSLKALHIILGGTELPFIYLLFIIRWYFECDRLILWLVSAFIYDLLKLQIAWQNGTQWKTNELNSVD